MSGVAANAVGFLLSWPPLTQMHTHTSAADVIHTGEQMHIITSPSTYAVTLTWGAHSFWPEFLAALIKMSQNTKATKHTKNRCATFCANCSETKAIVRKNCSFSENDQFNSKALVTVIGTFCCRSLIKVFLNCVKPWGNYLSSDSHCFQFHMCSRIEVNGNPVKAVKLKTAIPSCLKLITSMWGLNWENLI